MKAVAVIPARYASTRLPGKPLLDIYGKPLIQRVWEIVCRARGLDVIVVDTDDARIADAVEAFGGKAYMTSPDCQTGSDRVREVAASLAADVHVNVQGDEPLVEPSAIETLLTVFTQDGSVQVATLCSRINEEQARSPHQVKLVRDHAGNALYFSRAPLPFVREATESAVFLGHIGMYPYRADALRGFASLPSSPLGQAEKLEHLRFLQAGIPIRVVEVPPMGAGVDTPEDLERVRAVVRERHRAAALEKLKRVRLVITDVDGVLTDGGLYYGPDGECLKRFHARDGLGVRLLQQARIQVAVLSGRNCSALRRRLMDLGITEAVLGQIDKRAALSGIMERCGATAEEVAFIGDDISDMEVFGLCGVSVTVEDAPDYVKAKADLVLERMGGTRHSESWRTLFYKDRECNMKVLIPLQLCSTRVRLKNIRPFYGEKSLFDIKMEQLLNYIIGENIYISSESDDVIPLVEKYGAHFLKRPVELTGNAVKQPDLIGAILSQLPHDDEDIMWVQVTQPLFDAFGMMLDRWATIKKTHDSMVAVKTVRHHIVSQAGIPINFNFGHWHKVSQELPPLYEILWSVFILKRHTIETVKYHIGMRPYFIPFDDVTLVDIDTEEDFRMASEIYQLKRKRN